MGRSPFDRDPIRRGPSDTRPPFQTKNSSLFFDDPQFMTLYQEYESMVRVVRHEVEQAVQIMSAPQGRGPRRTVDLEKLHQVRRSLEFAAYRVFTYGVGGANVQPPPPDTDFSQARAYLRDATTAQHVQMPDRALRHLAQAQAKVEEMCKKALARFRAAPTPKSKEVKKQLATAMAISQSALHTSSVVTEVYDEVMKHHVEGILWDE